MAGAAHPGGQSAVSGQPDAVTAAAANSWTSDVVSAEQQWGGTRKNCSHYVPAFRLQQGSLFVHGLQTDDASLCLQGKDDKKTWAEALDSEGPLELDAMCWFYLDLFVSHILYILNSLGVAPLCMHVIWEARCSTACARQLLPLLCRTIKQQQ